MKVMTILGTRPEIIRLSLIIPRLDELCDHVLVHTGQNFDKRLSDIFFRELELRPPDHLLEVKGDTFGVQIGQMMERSEKVLREVAPDRLLILGDTDSALSSVMAKRLGIPVYHMEAGNRCYDDRVPEEVNRRIIDHASDVLMPYTERSRANLLHEGIWSEKIFVTGNPIFEVISRYQDSIDKSDALKQLGLDKKRYLLVTMHRQENVDDESRLNHLVDALKRLARQYEMPVIWSLHPRTESKIRKFGIRLDEEAVRMMPPFGFFDFVSLEQNAFCVLTDSGTVQEECCVFRVPNVTMRDVTERPETLECGSNILSGCDPETIIRCTKTVVKQTRQWSIPEEYLRKNVSDTVIRILLARS
jgi:UDP-N-acetylglucosamine 2-epimerase (non-hydrolysing)